MPNIMSKASGEHRKGSLMDKAGISDSLQLDADAEGAWIEVIRKMDSVYADLVGYQVELEQKNTELEEAHQFIRGVLSSMTDVLLVADRGRNSSTPTSSHCSAMTRSRKSSTSRSRYVRERWWIARSACAPKAARRRRWP